MNLLQLKYFVVAAESRTLAEAAEKLHVSQSTLSQSIKRLETELSVELFHQIGRKDQISRIGSMLYDGVVPLLAGFDALQHQISMARTEEQRVISVAMDAVDIGMESTIVYSKLHPDVTVNPTRGPYHTLQEQLKSGQVDFYLSFWPSKSEDIVSELLLSEPMLLVVNQNSPWAAQESVSIRDLANEVFVMMEDKYAIRRLFDGFFQSAGIQPRAIRLVGDQELMPQYVRNNLGCTFISECINNTQVTMPRAILSVENTIAISIKESFCKRDIFISYSKKRKQTNEHKEYLQFMRSYAAYIEKEKVLPILSDKDINVAYDYYFQGVYSRRRAADGASVNRR